MTMRISVIIPTYRRPGDLRRACRGLALQTRPADQLVVVARADDGQTQAEIDQLHAQLPISVAIVTRPGVVAALNAGLAVTTGDVVAITDDDAEPRPDWLERIERHFASDPSILGVGGRDFIRANAPTSPRRPGKVGTLQWCGRVTGNHHDGSGPPRAVDVLKGVNMSFRRNALAEIGFDERMRGSGAQVHFELALCLALQRLGGKLIYDPAVAVDHYPAARHDPDRRGVFVADPHLNAVHNQTLALLDHLSPPRRAAFALWSLLIGTRVEPGLAQLPRLIARREPNVLARWRATLAGRRAGFSTHLASASRPTSAARVSATPAPLKKGVPCR
jgi:GT2 family glycosyltransferase